MTFEIKVRLLTGLKLGKINANLNFFSKGLTTAVFHSLQKHPCPSVRLLILVIRGVTFGSISLSIVVGIASNLQDLDLRQDTI